MCDWLRKSRELRTAMMATVTAGDVEEITLALIVAAKKGDPWAIHEFYDRVIGRVKVESEEDTNEKYKELPQGVIDKALLEAGYVRIGGSAGAGAPGVSAGT
jgi:hypothetical protein